MVGFFYFSGLKELYETLKSLEDKGRLEREHIKILIGLNVDKTSHGIYEYGKISKYLSEELVKKTFLFLLKKLLSLKI